MITLDFLPWKKRRIGESVVVLTGAGTSMSTGLPGGPELSEAVLKKLAERTSDTVQRAIYNIVQKTPLETVFQILADHIGDQPVQKIIAGLNSDAPSSIHLALASLAQNNQIRTIYTFNFDLLHEAAFGSKPISVERNGRAILKVFGTNNGKSVPLWKFHGSCDSVGVITLSEYIRGFPPALIKALRNDLNYSPWLILGYGGRDIDFQATIHSAARDGLIPSEVIWIDRSFPEEGGLTDILDFWKAQGSCVQPLKQDIEGLVSNLLKGISTTSRPWTGELSELVNHLEHSNYLDCAGIIAEAALNCGLTKVAEDILASVPENSLRRERAFLNERKGQRNEAAEIYMILAAESKSTHTQAMAAIKAFVLSRGLVDCFDQVDTTMLTDTELSYFITITASKRTDTGGLLRDTYASMVKQLPSLENLYDSITSLDSARYFISTLSELARVQHEAKEWLNALDLDQMAYRIAQGLADPGVLAMCAGNIGACYMGLAENEKGEERNGYLKKARDWLHEAVQLASSIEEFAWALHTCNLGVVSADLGDLQLGIRLLGDAIPVLENVYPNYAVCFWGEFARCFGAAAMNVTGEERSSLSKSAIQAIEYGTNLANRLNDWDDLSFLKDAALKLKEIDSLPESLVWLDQDVSQYIGKH